MRKCIRCDNTTGHSTIGMGHCITCEWDDSDCDELVAAGKAQAVDETVAAIVTWLRTSLRHTIRREVLDAIERGDWKIP